MARHMGDSSRSFSKRRKLDKDTTDAAISRGELHGLDASTSGTDRCLADLPDDILHEIARYLQYAEGWEKDKKGDPPAVPTMLQGADTRPLKWLLAMATTCKAMYQPLWDDDQVWTSILNDRLGTPGLARTASEARIMLERMSSGPMNIGATIATSDLQLGGDDL